MKGSAGTTIVLLFFISIFDTRARILKDLEKAAVKKAKSFNTRENSTKLLNSVLNDMQKARAEFDSSDFDYSILLSDNSGLFDVKENARLTSMVTLGSALYKNAQLTDAERARFNLEMGEVLYANQKFAAAERKFSLAKNAYEKASLTSDVGYLKTIS
ncbi:MAG: hypothetical protein ABI477_22575, partial [Chryseolinea sp.]